MNILWFSSYQLTEDKMRTSGTWLSAMMEALIETNELQLYNITNGDVKDFTRRDCKGVSQWIIPLEKTDKEGLPSLKTIDFIKKLEMEIDPDLIHIWGTENYWGMLAARKILKKPVLLDMQGLLSACAKVYYGGLTNKELLYCIGPKQVLLPNRFLYFKKKEYERRAVLERFVIQKLPYISVQSEWVRSHVELENPTCNISPTGILLRKEFYEAQAWTLINNINPIIFTITNCAFCYKGLHILFRAIAILKQKIPTIQLRIAGHIQKHKFIDDGYIRWLNKEAKRLGINDSIEWLDALDADGLIKQFHAASVVAFPSFVESYCLALAETMIVGVPTVVSYAGGMTEMARHNETALYFPVGDIVSCAWQIEKILKDKMLSEKLSQNARIAGLSRNNPDRVIKRQLEIYNKVIVETANNN